MSYRIGVVKEIEPGGYAQVETQRKTVCGECNHQKIVCHGCLLHPKIVGRVANPIGAGKGDLVKVYLSSKKLFMAAGLFYLLPMFILLLGAISGLFLSNISNVPETGATIGFSVSGFVLGIIIVTVLGRTRFLTKLFQPNITKIVVSSDSHRP